MGAAYDLTDRRRQQLIRGWLSAGLVWGFHLGTICASFSRARFPAVRGQQNITGLPNLTDSQQLQ
eukprot:10901822-Lingulodinium_polyedra.AAC.1